MKFNQWTLGLAAVGAVSMASAVRADDAPKPSALNTALSNTTISGYISTSANVALDPNGATYARSVASNIPMQAGKQDGFNLDVVELSISKPEDATPYASGYQVELLFGPDANGIGNPSTPSASVSGTGKTSEVAIKQAYVTLNTPIGNGIDWKIGVFDTIIGYEAYNVGSNPNYTRSYGWAAEPTEHTGVLASYKVNDEWSFSAGVANTLSAGINTRNGSGDQADYWRKTILGNVVFSFPTSTGWAAGSSLYLGAVYGYGGGGTTAYAKGDQFNGYVGLTLNTPWKALTVGAAFDYVQNLGGGTAFAGYSYHTDETVIGLYANYKATDKLSLNARGEYIRSSTLGTYTGEGSYTYNTHVIGYELTGTVEYDLWANVMTRAEIRWDHQSTRNFGEYNRSAVGLYANVIYKF
jgi:hypothetical protein